jgi:hypothetical protein
MPLLPLLPRLLPFPAPAAASAAAERSDAAEPRLAVALGTASLAASAGEHPAVHSEFARLGFEPHQICPGGNGHGQPKLQEVPAGHLNHYCLWGLDAY